MRATLAYYFCQPLSLFGDTLRRSPPVQNYTFAFPLDCHNIFLGKAKLEKIHFTSLRPFVALRLAGLQLDQMFSQLRNRNKAPRTSRNFRCLDLQRKSKPMVMPNCLRVLAYSSVSACIMRMQPTASWAYAALA